MSLFSRSPESRYAPGLLRQLPVGVVVYRMERAGDPASFRIVYANPAAEAATGLSATREVGKRVLEVQPDASAARLDALAQVVASGQSLDLGVVLYGNAHRPEAPFAVHAVPLPDHAVGVVFEDVSDREALVALQAAQMSCAREEARYRALVEASAAIVWQASASGRFEDDQPQWRRVTGQSEAELLGWGWLDAVHPDDRFATQEAWAEAVRRQASYEIGYRLRGADGVYRRMHARAVPRLDNGAVVEWIGVHTDVEAEHEASAAVVQSQNRIQAIFDAIADVVLVYPLTAEGPGPLLTVNPAAVDVYGYPAEAFATMTIDDLVDPARTNVAMIHDELMREREVRYDSMHRTSDGRRLPMQSVARLFEYDDQLCVIAVCRDDSERRAFQHQMSRSNLDLERRVAERTAQLEDFASDLKILHRITTADHPTVHDRATAYLTAGCQMFDMPIGILSSLQPDPETGGTQYRIDAVVSPDDALSVGLTVPLSDAFCDDVVAQQQTVTFADAASDARLSCHSAYVERGLRSFIGAPIWDDERLVGTLNFVSPAPRANDFQPYERELAEIMADAMGRRLREDRLEREAAEDCDDPDGGSPAPAGSRVEA